MLKRAKLAVARIAYTQCHELSGLPTLERLFLPFLGFASLLFGPTLVLRQKLYRWGILKPVRLPTPVISVGNITWGGNGKTPMVEYLAWLLLHCGIPPLVLTRGYAGGDEARLLEAHLFGTEAVVGVGHNRVKTATALFDRFGSMSTKNIIGLASKLCSFVATMVHDPSMYGTSSYHNKNQGIGIVLLDDGMQHWKIKRDLEIVMINALSVFGNGKLIPCGPMREPLDSLARADVLVIHHANLVTHERLKIITSMLATICHDAAVVYYSKMLPRILFHIENETSASVRSFKSLFLRKMDFSVSLDVVKGADILCVSGIGCPESLSLILKELGAACIERMDFPDHHHFQSKDIFLIEKRLSAFRSSLAHKTSVPFVLLTEKDFARNPGIFCSPVCNFDVFILNSTLEIMDQSPTALDISDIIAQKIQKWRDEN